MGSIHCFRNIDHAVSGVGLLYLPTFWKKRKRYSSDDGDLSNKSE